MKNLSDDINSNIAQSEIDGGAWLNKLEVGKGLQVETKNTIYFIEKRVEGFFIHGHNRICPTPVEASIPGSTWGGSMLKMGFIGRGMHMEFSVNGKLYTTSTIQEVTEVDFI